jgi:hypothetical protein
MACMSCCWSWLCLMLLMWLCAGRCRLLKPLCFHQDVFENINQLLLLLRSRCSSLYLCMEQL